VGADALLLAVVDRAQVDGLLEVAPAALDLETALTARSSVSLAGTRLSATPLDRYLEVTDPEVL
jgi:hypothetical protein